MLRSVQKFVWAGLAMGLAVSMAHAQSWPSRQITFIVPFAPGGGTDAFARPLATQLDTQLGQRVIIENRAGPAMQDLVAGHVPLVFDGLGSSAPQIRSGQLRALAVAAPKRVPAFPDVPTAAEAGVPGYEVSTWYGVFAPKKTPPAVVERMTKELQKAMQTAAIKEAWERNGSDVPDVTGAAFGTMVAAETVRWQKVVTEAGVKLD